MDLILCLNHLPAKWLPTHLTDPGRKARERIGSFSTRSQVVMSQPLSTVEDHASRINTTDSPQFYNALLLELVLQSPRPLSKLEQTLRQREVLGAAEEDPASAETCFVIDACPVQAECLIRPNLLLKPCPKATGNCNPLPQPQKLQTTRPMDPHLARYRSRKSAKNRRSSCKRSAKPLSDADRRKSNARRLREERGSERRWRL